MLTGTNLFPGSFYVQDGNLMVEGSYSNVTAAVSGTSRINFSDPQSGNFNRRFYRLVWP